MIRVTHPHHPLYNQTVNVLRRAGNPAYPEPCYLIKLPDGTRAELPVSWAEAVDPAAPPPLCSDHELTPELWAGISEFLTLAALLHAPGSSALCSSVAEEVADENQNGPTNSRTFAGSEQPDGTGEPTQVGRPARSAASGTDPGPGGAAAARPGPASVAGGAL